MRWVAALLLLAVPALADDTATARTRIVSPAAAQRCFPGFGAYFRPSASDVRRLERLLPAYLRAVARQPTASWERSMAPRVLARLPRADREYYGVGGAQKRRIHVEAFGRRPGALIERCATMDDGRPDYWRIDFDPATGAFSGFEVNSIL